MAVFIFTWKEFHVKFVPNDRWFYSSLCLEVIDDDIVTSALYASSADYREWSKLYTKLFIFQDVLNFPKASVYHAFEEEGELACQTNYSLP